MDSTTSSRGNLISFHEAFDREKDSHVWVGIHNGLNTSINRNNHLDCILAYVKIKIGWVKSYAVLLKVSNGYKTYEVYEKNRSLFGKEIDFKEFINRMGVSNKYTKKKIANKKKYERFLMKAVAEEV